MSVITSNIQALNGARTLNNSQDLLTRSLSRLSSGLKIVNPSDDPAGLAVSDKLDSQSLRVQAASTNVQNAISYTQTSDGFLGNMTDVLSRMGQLATLAQDPTKDPADIAQYQAEFTALQDQLRSTIGGTTAEIGGTTDVSSPLGTFNGVQLFGPSNGITVPIGATPGQSITLGKTDLRDGAMLNVIQQDSSGNYTLKFTDADTVSKITDATQDVVNERGSVGASQSRLQIASSTLQIENENISSAVSRIRDVDVAQESTQLARYNILVQSGTAMLAQADQQPQSVLKLLQQG